MTSLRVEIRLDPEQRRKLDDIAKRNNVSISDIVRRLIDQEYEEEMRQRRIAAAERLGSMQIGEALEPDELKKLIESTYDVVLGSDFADKAALDAYQVHPAHEALKQFIGAVRESRECVDYQV